jgi:rRNA maturation RNase YbeY
MRGIRGARVRAEARSLLRILEVEDELSIALVGDEEIHSLNARYRKKDRPTDVLAFPVDHAIRKRCGLLGDVVISLDTAARQAKERNTPIDHEVRVLLIHGVLHLLGYDHERSPGEARRMFAKQRRLVARLDSHS